MRKLLIALMAAGLLLTFAALLGGILHEATSNRPGPANVAGQPAGASNLPPDAQPNTPGLRTDIPAQRPETRDREALGSDSLREALNAYDELYQSVFAQQSLSAEESRELARRRQVLDSLLIPRINAAIQRKYRRRPPFQDYPVAINNVVDMIYTKPCRGCINIDFEILAPTDVIEGRLPGYLPYDSFRISLHCPAKMNVDFKAANDEVF